MQMPTLQHILLDFWLHLVKINDHEVYGDRPHHVMPHVQRCFSFLSSNLPDLLLTEHQPFLHHLCSPSQQLGYSFYYSQLQVNMLRNALRQSSRAVGAVSASSRAATVSLTNPEQNPKRFLFIAPFFDGRTAPVKHLLEQLIVSILPVLEAC